MKKITKSTQEQINLFTNDFVRDWISSVNKLCGVRNEKKTPEWKIEFVKEVLSYSNVCLLAETIARAGGDDYDGCFTKKGEWKFYILKNFLEFRLKASGFLRKEDNLEVCVNQVYVK